MLHFAAKSITNSLSVQKRRPAYECSLPNVMQQQQYVYGPPVSFPPRQRRRDDRCCSCISPCTNSFGRKRVALYVSLAERISSDSSVSCSQFALFNVFWGRRNSKPGEMANERSPELSCIVTSFDDVTIELFVGKITE